MPYRKISELPSVMSPKAEKLVKLVDAIPSCEAGKVAIRNLVAEITGEDLTPKQTYRVGQRFRYKRNPYRAVVTDYILSVVRDITNVHPQVHAVNLETGGSRTKEPIEVVNIMRITEHELLEIFGTHDIKRITPL